MIFSTRSALLLMGVSMSYGMVLHGAEQKRKEAQRAYDRAVVSGGYISDPASLQRS